MKKIKDYEAMAKLNLSEEEGQWVSDRADMLLDSFQGLEKINTDHVEPLASVLNVQNVLREDKSVKMLSREELLANAPDQYDGYFQVPKTLD